MRLTDTEIMQIIQWRIWSNATVKTRFLKTEQLRKCHLCFAATSVISKRAHVSFFSIQKAVILTLVNIKVLFMLDFISHLYEKHCLNMRILSKTCLFFSVCINCSLKYKTSVGVHFHGCEIKTKLKEKQVKAPNIGFIYNEISEREQNQTQYVHLSLLAV